MSFDITPTGAQHDLARRTHEFAESVIRPVAADYDARQEFPWPVLEEAAERGFYSPLFYRDLIGDPTGLSLPMFMEELFWGCAGIGLAIVMPALALSAIGQAASPEQMLQWAPECFGAPGDLKLAALAISEPEGGSDVRNLRTRATGTVESRLDHRRPQDVDRQRRHRQRARGERRCGRGAGASGPGPVHRARRHARPGDGAQAGQARLSCVAHRGAEVQCACGCQATICSAGRRSSNTSWPGHARPSRVASIPARRRWARSNRPGRWWPLRRSASPGPQWNTRPNTRTAARRSARRSSTIRASRFPLADLATAIDAARLLTWRASWMAATGVPFERGEGSMSKLAASEVAVRTTERAIQTMGGWGYIKDHPVEKWYRDAKLYTIFEGTSEIQRVVISNALGAADGKPPLHFDLEPSGGPLNRMFGRGTPVRTQVANSALGDARSHPAAGHAAGDEGAPAAQEVAWRHGRQDDGSAQRQPRRVAV